MNMNSVRRGGDSRSFSLRSFDGRLLSPSAKLVAGSLSRLAALLHQFGDHAGPTCLMAGADPCTRVAMEVLVEQDQVAPMRVSLELFQIPEHWAAAVLILKKDAGHATREFSRHLPQAHHRAGSGRVLNLEICPKIVMELLE